MRIILFIIFSIPSFVFAAACPTNTQQVLQFGSSPIAPEPSVSSMASISHIPAAQLTTVVASTSQATNPYTGQPMTLTYYNVCKLNAPVTCQSNEITSAGQHGANYSCQPPPCPSTHPTSSNNGKQCKDSNGCNQDQSFVNGFCVNKKIEEIATRCMNAAGGGNVATVTVPADGSGPTCSVGGPVDMGTVPTCTTAPGGTACVVSQNASGDKTGMQCGNFNGASVCVASSETSAVGTSSTPVGTTSQPGTPKTLEEQVSTMGETTTTVRTVIPDVQQTTTVNDSSPVGEGQQVNSGAGASGVPPITCSNGMKAANLQSCDTDVVCPADSYVAYGVCIKSPTRTTTVIKENTTTTTTVRNDSTGAVVSQNQTSSTTTTPVKISGGGSSGSGSVQNQVPGQCDPTAKNYQECVGLLVPVSNTLQSDTNTANNTAFNQLITDKDNSEKAAIAATGAGQLNANTTGVKNILNPVLSFFQSPACTPLSYTVGPRTFTISCDVSAKIKSVLGFIFYMYTLLHIYQLFFRSKA